jgi:hypothetical protein
VKSVRDGGKTANLGRLDHRSAPANRADGRPCRQFGVENLQMGKINFILFFTQNKK